MAKEEVKKVIKSKKIVKKEEYKPIFKIKEVSEIPKIPDYKTRAEVDVKYPLIEPFVNAHIFWDNKAEELIYHLEEPVLTPSELKILHILEKGIEELINISFIGIKTKEAVIEFLEKNVKVLLNELDIKVNEDSFLKLMYYIYRDFVGLNKIEPLMKDYFIEDIECNGVVSPVYIVHRKYRNLKTNIVYQKIESLTHFVEKIAQKCGKYISYANPLLDGRLPDGSRVNATYTQDISSKGPTFTIRKFTKEPWSPIKLMNLKSVSPEILSYLWLAVEYESNLMVIGGTGSGKTTMLNSIAFFVPPAQRIVSIEDTHELNLNHENWLPSVARAGFGAKSSSGEMQSEVSLFDLLKESFRQRPDYVIVGEIRGKEAYVLFQGAASGHATMSTMHAEDVYTLVRRLETPPINLSPALVKLLNVVCVMTQAKIGEKPVRRLRAITEIIDVDKNSGEIITNEPFIWDPRQDKFFFKSESKLLDKIAHQYGLTKQEIYREFKLRAMLMMAMYRQKVFGFNEVAEVIKQYYKNKKEVLRRFGVIK